MISQHNIVVLGASYSGLQISHYLLKHVIPKLPRTSASHYKLYLLNPSPDFYHAPSGPRGTISKDNISDNLRFLDIAAGFKVYAAQDFEFVHGTAVAWDEEQGLITYSTPSSANQTLPYHALVIATGAKPNSALFHNLSGTLQTQETVENFRTALSEAKKIIIGGGGPTGVETAGEIGEYLNGKLKTGWFGASHSPRVEIVLLTSGTRLLPGVREDIAKHAEGYLKNLGVDVRFASRIASVAPNGAGQTGETIIPRASGEKAVLILEDGQRLEADIFIPTMGVKPNTSFVSNKGLLDGSGRVFTNHSTLRVDMAGPRVYALGDVSSASPGGIMHTINMTPVLATNLKRDLIAALSDKEAPDAGTDREFIPDLRTTQLVPIGKSKGVGQLFGWNVPSFMVWLIKGRDYMISKAPELVDGRMVAKESLWNLES